MKRILTLATILFLAACGGNDEKAAVTEAPQAPLGQSVNSDTFNLVFGKMLDSYFQLKDQFIKENDTLITKSTEQLIADINAAEGILSELKADSSIVSTAKTYTTGINNELTAVKQEKDIEERRKSFQVLSEQLYDLIRTVKYDRAVVYHQYCPMAFNDAGAFWLSNSSDIRNPYLPKKMLICGEVKDSIDFRKL
jgi:Cu(I)/Ag(I) efflux system membrane fusion protein